MFSKSRILLHVALLFVGQKKNIPITCAVQCLGVMLRKIFCISECKKIILLPNTPQPSAIIKYIVSVIYECNAYIIVHFK